MSDLEPPVIEEKPFLEHLEDLRVTLLKCAGALAIGLIAAFVFTREILGVLMAPIAMIGEDPQKFVRVLGVVDPLAIQLQVGFVGGIVLALPFLLYFIGEFILPALTEKERRLLIPVFGSGAVLFVGGMVFCYFLILPQTLKFFVQYNAWLGFETDWTIQNYLGFVVQMLLAFGLCFELPLVILVLNHLGIVSHRMLHTYRRHAIVVILILAACITPSSDPFSLGMLAGPMMLLYELCIWITWWRERRGIERE